MKPAGQDKLTFQRDNETLAEAIERQKQEKAMGDRLLAEHGKLEGGLDGHKV